MPVAAVPVAAVPVATVPVAAVPVATAPGPTDPWRAAVTTSARGAGRAHVVGPQSCDVR
ncbi:hypothetical protein [Motilibacter deserti]|uniref:Uncharacterized protein n=1 Tax=Motilibacter deserti TaxID=2714956 RepID=A0ABX0GWU0_9ACTN|nr:hypothetical protein [Motilibacter deserti]NHC14072.1 hypothetical protein [Motilibacter deserti]